VGQGFSVATDGGVSLDPSGATEWFVCSDGGVLTVLPRSLAFPWWFSRVWGVGRGRRSGGLGDWADGRFIMGRKRVKILRNIVVPSTSFSLVTLTKTLNPAGKELFGGIRCDFCGDGSDVFGMFFMS